MAFICTEKLPSPAIKGGAIQILIDGVAPILSRQHQLTIYSVQDPSLPDFEKNGGIIYKRIAPEEYAQEVAEDLAQSQFDLIHVFNRPNNVALYKAASPESVMVLSLHNEMFHESKISYDEGCECIEQLDGIMTVSEYIKDTVVKRFPEADSKITVVYSGINPEAYHPVWTPEGTRMREELRQSYNVQDKKVILFVGRLSVNKGPHLLIKAMKYVLEAHPNAVLMVAGGKWFSDDGLNNYVRYLYKLAEPYGDSVKFTKFIPADEIPRFYSMGDVFVCSSQWNEPLARVHYEAMGAGIPVITTKRGGNPEVITDMQTGLIVKNYQNPRSFAKAIGYVFDHPDLAAFMAKNERRFVESKFCFEHVVERLMNFYTKAQSGALPQMEQPKIVWETTV